MAALFEKTFSPNFVFSNLQQASIGSYDELAPNRRQAITQTCNGTDNTYANSVFR